MARMTYNSIDEYINSFSGLEKERLIEIRNIINNIVPKETIEKISWSMPTFYLKGNLVHFAGFKHHTGFYPGASGVENLKEKLKHYKTSKGAIQFSYDKPLPKELIEEIVTFRIKENLND
jgi:uncharacterized protein YdhG (YjbR/CyaY superfamily)